MSNPDTVTDQPPAPRRDDGLREYAGESGGYLGAVYEGLSRITSDPDLGKVISRLGGVAGTGFGAWERAGDAEGITAKDAALGEKCLSSWQNQVILTSDSMPLGECRFRSQHSLHVVCVREDDLLRLEVIDATSPSDTPNRHMKTT